VTYDDYISTDLSDRGDPTAGIRGCEGCGRLEDEVSDYEDADGIDGPFNRAMGRAMAEDREHESHVQEGKRIGDGCCWCKPMVVGDVIVHRGRRA
jgi:hypothetical protein